MKSWPPDLHDAVVAALGRLPEEHLLALAQLIQENPDEVHAAATEALASDVVRAELGDGRTPDGDTESVPEAWSAEARELDHQLRSLTEGQPPLETSPDFTARVMRTVRQEAGLNPRGAPPARQHGRRLRALALGVCATAAAAVLWVSIGRLQLGLVPGTNSPPESPSLAEVSVGTAILRNSSQQQPKLVISPEDTVALVHVAHDRALTPDTDLRVGLRDAEGLSVWSSVSRAEHLWENPGHLQIPVPARALQSGTYTVVLSEVGQDVEISGASATLAVVRLEGYRQSPSATNAPQ